MKTYIYSIFVRFFLAFTGFGVFVVTAFLFGAEGRGIIGYGTSLFAIIGMVCSLNLGRSFVALTKGSEDQKRHLLTKYIKLNFLMCLLTACIGLFYWLLSPTAQNMLSLKQVALFSLMSVYYVWNINGNAFYAAFLSTKLQENIILTARLTLMSFLIILYFNKSTSLDTFIAFYASILFLGPVSEILYLLKTFSNQSPAETPAFKIFKQSIYHHLDFISFNIFPLFATVLLATYASKADVGRYNFALQIMSLIFLFAATANIRITAYVSDVGYKARINQYKKLFWATLSFSCVAIALLYFAIDFAVRIKYFSQFEGVSTIFLICGLSVPGYIFYQFFSPIWIELSKQKYSAAVHGINFLICAIASPFVFAKYGINGAAWMFAIFHFGLLLSQGILYAKFMRIKLPHKELHEA